MLATEGLAIWRDRHPVLQDINLHVEAPGLLFIVGPGGSGKSTLLHALRGPDTPADIRMHGEISFGWEAGPAQNLRIVHVPQHAALDALRSPGAQLSERLGCPADRLWAWADELGLDVPPKDFLREDNLLSHSMRRALGVLALLDADADLYLIDEPTAGLDTRELHAVRGRINALARHASTVVATHNRRDCLMMGGHTALLVNGRIRESAPSQRFFSHPSTPMGRTYVATGNCIDRAPQPHTRDAVEGAWWLACGQLCGMSRPGLVASRETQFQALAEQGVSQLICLEEQCVYPTQGLRELGMAHYHFPIVDMSVPTFSQAVDMCRLTAPELDAGRSIAMHCRGGLGRTGTMLAVLRVWQGDPPSSAIDQVRTAKPRAIQTDPQICFVHDFANRTHGWH